MNSWIERNKQQKNQSQQPIMGVLGNNWRLRPRASLTFPECFLCSSLSFSHSSSRASLKPSLCSHSPDALAHWPLPPPCHCTPLLLNSPFTLPFNHSIPDHENCFICARVCKWKQREARGPGFYAVPRRYIQEIVLLLNLEKVYKFKFHRVFFAEGKVSYSGPLAHYSEVRATWARSAWSWQSPASPKLRSPCLFYNN